MRAAFLSKDPRRREAFVRERITADRVVLYLYPGRRWPKMNLPGHVLAVSFEDITKRDVWLRINNLAPEDAFLVLDGASRYPKISSEKVRRLRRLSMRLKGDRLLVDIVPFTLSVEYLYTPYSYLGRDILGYPHWYAFRENYQELDETGGVVHAHDFPVLARKIAPVTEIDYPAFLAGDRTIVRFSETAEERDRYQQKRSALFERMGEGATGPQKIITRLADLTHAFPTRMDRLLSLCGELKGDTVVFTNLASYAQRTAAALKSAGLRARCASYQVGIARLSEAENVIYLESPIVNSYHFLDVESELKQGARVFHFLGEMKVDQYLCREITHETAQIDALTRALYEVKHG